MKRKNRTAHKRLLEKRRRTRKQRGGADEATSVGEWVRRVKLTHIFKEKGNYVLGDLKDAHLALPPSDDYSIAFDINNGTEAENKVDIRQEGAAIKEFLKESFSKLPALSPVQFKDFIMEVRRSEIGDAKDIVDSIMFMIRIENKLRKDAGEEFPLLEENPDELANDSRYPLFIWALLMNNPDTVSPGFSLNPPTEPPTEPEPSPPEELAT